MLFIPVRSSRSATLTSFQQSDDQTCERGRIKGSTEFGRALKNAVAACGRYRRRHAGRHRWSFDRNRSSNSTADMGRPK